MTDKLFVSAYASTKKNALLPVVAVTRMVIDALLPCKASVANSKKFVKYHKCFPKNQLCWMLPKPEDNPLYNNSNLHSITDMKIYNLCWEVQFLELNLKCGKDGCTGGLHYDWNDFTKN